MKREDLFLLIKNSEKEYNTISKIEGITEKIPTFFETDFKDIIENPILCKILKKYLNTTTELSEEYKQLLNRIIEETPADPIIIGVCGTWGKTTTCNLLYKYLRACGKHVCLLSSSKLENPFLKYESNTSNINWINDNNHIKEFLKKALISNPDYIIIETHEFEVCVKKVTHTANILPIPFQRLEVGHSLFEDIPFDYKICTNFEAAVEPVLVEAIGNDDIKDAILNFMTPALDEISLFNVEDTSFSQEFYNLNKNNANIKWVVRDNSVKFPAITAEIGNNYFSKFNSFLTDLCSCSFSYTVNNNIYQNNIWGKVDLAKDVLMAVSLLEYLNLFNKELFDTVLNNLQTRAEQIIKLTNNRTIIISQQNYIDFINIYRLHTLKPESYVVKPENGQVICLQSSNSRYGYGFGTYEDYSANKIKAEPWRKHDLIDNNTWQYLDKLVILPLSPGELDPLQACNDIKEVFDKYLPEHQFDLSVNADRRQGIANAVAALNNNDILIISGRGKASPYFCKADKDRNNGYEVALFTDFEVAINAAKEAFGEDAILEVF